MTQRLYEDKPYEPSFTATVKECRDAGGGEYDIVLDRTAFFPEGGGQAGDCGTIGGVLVYNTREKDGIILHRTHAPLDTGIVTAGTVNFAVRFDRMQNHTAEHIVSGIAHRLYGATNVGFHLNDEEITLDFDKVLSREDLDEIEDMANRAIAANIPVRVFYPSPEELAATDYRSKKELSGRVRLVAIEGYDLCACCAPHVRTTGEIGIIKLLDFIHYKGGVRIHLKAGRRALLDYRARYAATSSISRALSVPQDECAEGVERILSELGERKLRTAALARALSDARAAALTPNGAGNILAFFEDTDDLSLRNTAIAALFQGATLAAILSPSADGFAIAITAKGGLRALTPTLRARLSLRGGGSDELVQGRTPLSRAEIEAFFAEKLM